MKSQLESSSKLKKIQPKLQKLQKKYKDKPQKLQEAQLKLYQDVGYNPLGCFLSVIIPYPILLAIYQAVQAFSGDTVEGVYDFVANFIGANGDIVINQRFLIWDLDQAYLPLGKEYGYWEIWVLGYLLLAVLVGLSQYLSIKLNSMRKKKKKSNNKKDKKKDKRKDDKKDETVDMVNEMGKSLALTLPMMTTFIALSAPAAVSIYWIVQSWVLVGIQTAYYKFKSKKNG